MSEHKPDELRGHVYDGIEESVRGQVGRFIHADPPLGDQPQEHLQVVEHDRTTQLRGVADIFDLDR